MTSGRARRCIDCSSFSVETASSTRARPAPHPGPRCASHHREKTRERRSRAHAAHVLKTYRITAEQYARIVEVQGGRCAICQRATGMVRRLAVDHDHQCCAASTSCGQCVRGALCRPCNRMLGHVRDDVATLRRAVDYLTNPPARKVLTHEAA